MPRSVIVATASAGLALAFTAFLAVPSMAMSASHYSAATAPIASSAEVSGLFSGRLDAWSRKQEREAQQLADYRNARENARTRPVSTSLQRSFEPRRPIDLQ